MSTVRAGEVRFHLYPQDHLPRHAHAMIGSGQVIVNPRVDRTVGLANRPDAVIGATRSEVRKVASRRRALRWPGGGLGEDARRMTASDARVTIADAELDASLAQGRLTAPHLPRAVRAAYCAADDAIKVELGTGVVLLLPRRLLQGLGEASPGQLAEIEILGPGTGLYWPRLNVDHYLPGLLLGVFGTREWMAELDRTGGAISRSAAPNRDAG